MLAKLPQDLVVVPDDVLHKFLLLLNSHDGSTAMVCRFVATRVVCENTLNAALAERGNARQVIVRHTRGAPVRVDEARRVLSIGLKYFDVFGERCRALSSKQLNREMLRQYFEAVFPYPPAGHSLEPTRKLHEVLAFLFEKGRGNELRRVKGSLWAAYNAVTEYVDHVRGITPVGVPRANREESALFGKGEEIKRRAFDESMALLGS